MNTPTHTITFLSLLQKYGGKIKMAHPDEMRAARAAIPKGQNGLGAYFQAAREYKQEMEDREEDMRNGQNGWDDE